MHDISTVRDIVHSIKDYLAVNATGSIQRTDVHPDGNRMIAMHLPNKGRDLTIEAYLMNQIEGNIRFDIDFSRPGVPRVDIHFGTGDVMKDLAKIKAQILTMRKTVKDRIRSDEKGGGGGNKSKGYYLAVGTPKGISLSRFDSAIRERVIPPNFKEFCVTRNLKMTYCKGTNPKK